MPLEHSAQPSAAITRPVHALPSVTDVSPWSSFPAPRHADDRSGSNRSPTLSVFKAYRHRPSTIMIAQHLSTDRTLSSSTLEPADDPVASSPARQSPLASIGDLPHELLLQIASYLFLPPTEFASAHERNEDLKALGYTCRHLQELARTVLFRQLVLQSKADLRWILRRPEFLAHARSVGLTGTSPCSSTKVPSNKTRQSCHSWSKTDCFLYATRAT